LVDVAIVDPQKTTPATFIVGGVGVALYFALFLTVTTYIATEVFNLAINRTLLAPHYRFESTMSALTVVWLVASNLVLILLTLGLYYPWARVRTARYTASCLAVMGPADMDGFTSELVSGQGAIGEEIASFFDVEVSL
jgi:uncharacterized membrane protein YjgN (DUF898 family)